MFELNFKPVKEKCRKPLKHFAGKRIGVDLSVWLHQICSRDSVVHCLTSTPPYPLDAVVVDIKERCKAIVAEGPELYFVADGFRHSMKSVARATRDRRLNTAKKWLHDFYKDAREGIPITEERRAKLNKNLAAVAVPNDTVLKMVTDCFDSEGIEYECAPFEAEAQLVHLEKEGFLDAILSVDGDHIILGARNLLTDLRLNSMTVCLVQVCFSHPMKLPEP